MLGRYIFNDSIDIYIISKYSVVPNFYVCYLCMTRPLLLQDTQSGKLVIQGLENVGHLKGKVSNFLFRETLLNFGFTDNIILKLFFCDEDSIDSFDGTSMHF